jgi:tetratricopeptide (TPR) repeat protein
MPNSVQQGVGLAVHGATFLTRHAYTRAEQCFARSLVLRRALNDAWGLCQTWHLLGLSKLWQANFAEAEAHLRRAAGGFSRLGEHGEARAVMMPIFDSLYQRGMLPEAESHIRQVLTQCETAHDRSNRNIALYNLMLVHLARGNFEEARNLAAECQKESLEHNDHYRYCLARGAQGRIALYSGTPALRSWN